MLRLRSDLPFGGDPSGRFLPWIVGFMAYLAALAVSGAISLNGVAEQWHAEISGSLTVQIAPPAEAGPDEPPADSRESRLERTLELLRNEAAIAEIAVLEPEEMDRLLAPWLGPESAALGLPLPDLVSITLRPGARLDIERLSAELARTVPGATIDDHRRWLDDLAVLVSSAELLATIVVTLVCLAAILTVIFVTRTGLAVHSRVIEIVHLIGARDAYIAGQFQSHALRLGFIGGTAGTALAALTLVGLQRLFAGLETPLLDGPGLGPAHWATLAVLPVVAALIAMVTARVTVLRSLARMSVQ